jgi:hypothetical protein
MPSLRKLPVDLEHPLEAAHQQALEVQLRRDAQVHLLVERVVVRGEGLGVGAAGIGCSIGVSTSRKPACTMKSRIEDMRLAARHEAPAGLFVRHQVDVALAVLHLLVGHAVELVRHGAQALGEQADRGGVQRQLAGARLEHLAFGAEDVAEIPALELVVGLLAHRVAGDVDLDAAAAVLQGGEAGLAHDALEHHAAGHARGRAFAFQLFGGLAAVGGVQGRAGVAGLEVVGEGGARALPVRLAQGLELLAALRDQLVLVGGGGGRGGLGFGHGRGRPAGRNRRF